MVISMLAPELLQQCLSNLDPKDLASTSLVCRAWLRPSRKLQWDKVTLFLGGYIEDGLLDLLNDKSTIPHHIGGIMIDESDMDYDDEEESSQWRAELRKVMDHFSSVGNMTIRFLDLKKFPKDEHKHILRPGATTEALVIQNLLVEDPSDVMPYVLENPRLKFLGLGTVAFANQESEVPNAQPSSPFPVDLPRLRHLVLFSSSPSTWSGLVPHIGQGSLEDLKMMVALCKDNEAVGGLIRTSEASLTSLALGLESEGSVFDLSSVKSLTNLSIDIGKYPGSEFLLLNMVKTITSSTVLQRVFINCGPGMLKPERQLESAQPLWETHDKHLSKLPGLKTVVFTLVIDSCLGMLMSMPQASGPFDKWKDDVKKYAESKLPACHEKGLIQVATILGSWTGKPFADTNIEQS